MVVRRMKATALAALMAIVGINVWTGGPLLAVWVGSKVQGGGPPSMTAILVILAVLSAVSLVLVRLLAVLGDAYDQVTGGAQSRRRRQSPWMRSMRGERVDRRSREEIGLTGAERILIAIVVLAVAAFEVWFFFLAGSSIGHN